MPYRWLVMGLATLALVSQGLEYWLRDPGFSNLRRDVIEGLAFVGVLLFPLIYIRVLRQEVTHGLVELRPGVLISDTEYESHTHGALYARRGVEIALFLAALNIGLLLFFLPPQELIGLASARPGGIFIIICLIAAYVLVGWVAFILVYTTIRYARGLAALARRPLAVNVFDTANLLPFGRLSLLYSLSPFGIVLIPLLLLGPPKQVGGYLMGLLSAVSLLLIFIPLWGVHSQIRAARTRALANIGQQLMEVQDGLLGAGARPPMTCRPWQNAQRYCWNFGNGC